MRDHRLRFKIRAKRVREKIANTSSRFRLSVFRSKKHIYAQIINDAESMTVASASTLNKNVILAKKSVRNLKQAAVVGELIGQKAHDLGIKEVVFDKGGYNYHGVIKCLADSARKFLNF